MRTKFFTAVAATSLVVTAIVAAPAQADVVADTSVVVASVSFVPGSNSISDAGKRSIDNSRWRARAAAGLVVTSYTRTSSSRAGAIRAGKVRSAQRALKVVQRLNLTVPVTYRLFAAKRGAYAKNAVVITAEGFEATMSDCAAYTGMHVGTIRARMGLAANGTQDGAAHVQLAPKSGTVFAVTADADLLCGGSGTDAIAGDAVLQNPGTDGNDLFIGGAGPDTVSTIDGGVFSGGPGADMVTTLTTGSFYGGGGADSLTTFGGGCVTAVETVPAGAVTCL